VNSHKLTFTLLETYAPCDDETEAEIRESIDLFIEDVTRYAKFQCTGYLGDDVVLGVTVMHITKEPA